MSASSLRLEMLGLESTCQLTVPCLQLESGIGPVNYAEVDLLMVLDLEYLHGESDLAFLDHEWALSVEIGATEIRIN